MRTPLWEPCDPPTGYEYCTLKYRAWRRTDRPEIMMIECPSHVFMHVNSGKWLLQERLARNELGAGKTTYIAHYSWYGRGLTKPPTRWANKVLKEKGITA